MFFEGQKVVCVDNGPMHLTKVFVDLELDGVYTILKIKKDVDKYDRVWLYETPNFVYKKKFWFFSVKVELLGYYLDRFRPLDEVNSNIKIFHKILQTINEGARLTNLKSKGKIK